MTTIAMTLSVLEGHVLLRFRLEFFVSRPVYAPVDKISTEKTARRAVRLQ